MAGSYTPAEREAASEAAAAPAAKRQRGEDSSSAGGSSGAGKPNGPAAWQLELHLFMQHAGLFLLTAATKAPDCALAWFAGLMQRLQAALGARWTVQA